MSFQTTIRKTRVRSSIFFENVPGLTLKQSWSKTFFALLFNLYLFYILSCHISQLHRFLISSVHTSLFLRRLVFLCTNHDGANDTPTEGVVQIKHWTTTTRCPAIPIGKDEREIGWVACFVSGSPPEPRLLQYTNPAISWEIAGGLKDGEGLPRLENWVKLSAVQALHCRPAPFHRSLIRPKLALH